MSEEIKPDAIIEIPADELPEVPLPPEIETPLPPRYLWHSLEESQDYSPMLNKKIATHLQFRAKVEARAAGTDASFTSRRHYRPETAHHEALRRELFLRHDLIKYARAKGLSAGPHEEAFAMINAELAEIGGHFQPSNAITGFRS